RLRRDGRSKRPGRYPYRDPHRMAAESRRRRRRAPGPRVALPKMLETAPPKGVAPLPILIQSAFPRSTARLGRVFKVSSGRGNRKRKGREERIGGEDQSAQSAAYRLARTDHSVRKIPKSSCLRAFLLHFPPSTK